MASLTQTDITVRLQLANCCIATLTSNLLPKLKIGASDVQCKLQELEVLKEMLEAVKCYDPDDTENNCLTETQMLAIFDYIGKKCNLCFQPAGYRYSS